MDNIAKQFRELKKLSTRFDDDRVDRLSSIYTVLLMVVFAILVNMTQWIGKPIICWTPKHFTGAHIKFANSYCWIKTTYYLPFDDEIPKGHEGETRQNIQYYPWIPFILLAQALFFYAPSAVWHSFNQQAGVDADNIVQAALMFSRTDKIKSKPYIKKMIINQIDRFLGSRQAISKAQFKHLKEKMQGCSSRRWVTCTLRYFLKMHVCPMFM